MRLNPYPYLIIALILATTSVSRAHEAATEMAAAAKQFLASLSPELKQQAIYPLTHAERENWNFVPIARQGLPFKQMTTDQQALGMALLRTGLSEQGHQRAQAIMMLELVLKELENDTRGRRDPTMYFITIFGEPDAAQSWGWRFEGHHLSLNFTIVNGSHVFFAPSFMGTNPAEVRSGPRKGERVLGPHEDLGFALINSLSADQRKIAVFSDTALREIVTTNQKRVEPLSPAGIKATELTAAQRTKLNELVKLYVDQWRPELAEETFAEITAAGLDQITFAWAGGFTRTTPSYYRIQGPTFLIEFDNSQNNGNHIHSTFREFKGDFGHDLLREHYARDHQTQQ